MTPFTELQDFVVKHTDAKYFEADLKLFKRCFPQSKLIPELDIAPEYAKKNLDDRMATEILSHPDMCIDTLWEARGFALINGKLVPMEELKQTGLTEDEILEIAKKASGLIESIAGSSNMEGVATNEKEIRALIEPIPEGAQNPIISKLQEAIATAKRRFAALKADLERQRNEKALIEVDLSTLKYNQLKKLVFALALNKKCEDGSGKEYTRVLQARKDELNAEPAKTEEKTTADTPAPGEQQPTPVGSTELPPVIGPVEAKKKEAPEQSTQE